MYAGAQEVEMSIISHYKIPEDEQGRLDMYVIARGFGGRLEVINVTVLILQNASFLTSAASIPTNVAGRAEWRKKTKYSWPAYLSQWNHVFPRCV